MTLIKIQFKDPEQFRTDVVQLIRAQGISYSIDYRKARRKKLKADLKSKSDGLEFAARFIELLEISK